MIDPRTALAVFLGAGAGGVLRYAVGAWFFQRFGSAFPYGTMFINISGSFLIGMVIELAGTRALTVTPMVRAFIATGILGGYTTFSTFSYEMYALAAGGSSLLAIVYGIGSVLLGFAAAYGGIVLIRLVAAP